MKSLRLILLAAATLSGCAPVGPDYHRVDVETPSYFKESNEWKFARPADATPRGAWWTVFRDATLNNLESQLAAGNPNLRAALLRVEQARLLARGSRVGLLPSATFSPSAIRRSTSNNVLQGSNTPVTGLESTHNVFSLPLDASYEIDFWGRVRRTIEAADADAQAAAALGETARLTLHADMAQNYFALRSVQAEIVLLEDSVVLRGQSLKLERDRLKGGATSGLEVARSEAELAAVESELAGLQKRRAELVNAIAVLAGRPASTFDLKVKPLEGAPPSVPAGVPAALLQRRPDISEAERRMAAANARIGVAKAAFFPSIRLVGTAGLESSATKNLFKAGSRAWSIGPSINFPIFEQFLNRTVYEGRKLEYEESIANYQSSVLSAFQEVENSLSGLRLLTVQAAAQQRAVVAAEQAARLSTDRFEAGLVSNLEKVDAERTRLQALQLSRQITGQRYVTAVQLIKALGGGW